jgi:hypothetical protein
MWNKSFYKNENTKYPNTKGGGGGGGKKANKLTLVQSVRTVLKPVAQTSDVAGDMNARIGNNKITNVMGKNGEAMINNGGEKLINFCISNNLKIMNTYFRHKNTHKYTWSARGSQLIINYTISNGKVAKIIQDIRVHRGMELDTDHYLLCAKVKVPPRWLNKSGSKRILLKPEEFFKIRHIKDESVKWLYQQRVKIHLSNIPENYTDIVEEWKIYRILKKAAF